MYLQNFLNLFVLGIYIISTSVTVHQQSLFFFFCFLLGKKLNFHWKRMKGLQKVQKQGPRQKNKAQEGAQKE